ncbi:MAG: dihydropteroate synthase [Bacteroidales bacterium]|nr:dihydropteroate synthase [Bacteroidales bacterium]
MIISKGNIFSSFSLRCGKNIVEFDRPCVMGILNVTPDSFYDGGSHVDDDSIIRHAHWLLDEGADIIDVGAVSSRPGAILLPPDEEAARLRSVMSMLRRELPADTIISVDTCYSRPAEAAVEAGADIINDISGGQFDEDMFPTVARLKVPYVLSHTRGLPSEMQMLTDYDDLMREIQFFFSERLEMLYRLGVADVLLDPGFGFAKTTDQNYELMAHLCDITTTFRQPVLVGVSRKSMIYKALGITPQESLNGTTVLNTIALLQGAKMLRVHDPREARQTIEMVGRMW